MQRSAGTGNRGVALLSAIVISAAIGAGVYDWTVIRAAEVEYGLARRDGARRSYGPALQHIRRAQSLCPDNAVYWAEEGSLSAAASATPSLLDPLQPLPVPIGAARERLESGLMACRKAAALAPEDSLLRHNMAWLCLMTGSSGPARESLNRAIELDPREPLYRVSSALWHERNSDLRAAASEYAAALALSPALVDSLQFIAFERRHPAEHRAALRSAAAQLQDEYSSTRDPLAAARLAKLLSAGGRDAEARPLLEDALRQLPALSRAWLNLGQLYERDGEAARARMCYLRAVFLDRSEVSAWERLATRLEPKSGRAWAEYGYRQALRSAALEHRGMHGRGLYQSAGALPDEVAPAELVESCSPVRGLAATCQAYQARSLPAAALPDRVVRICASISSGTNAPDYRE